MATVDWDTLSKIVQSFFYLAAIALGVLTYRRARTTILNTVNTEYHKKVIERLADLSDVLYSEFDQSSAESWTKKKGVSEVVDEIHAEFKEHRASILESKEWGRGILVGEELERLEVLAQRYRSDPFLPDQIRKRTLSLLEGRVNALREAHGEVLDAYTAELALGRHESTLDTNKYWIHNKVNRKLIEAGYGIEDVEKEVHGIRLDIQSYFKKFEP